MMHAPDDALPPDHTIDLPDGSASKVGMFAGASGATDANLEKPGDQVGPYKLISQLGEGGFGTVWLAERRQPFVQQVALKVIKAGMDSKAVIARFEQERQALAVMNHPHVAKVLDGGLTAQGRPYFAMEFVKGEPITDFCDKHKLKIRERLALFTQVCEAIQHAHGKGIIHRDLKPGNVLVGMGENDRPAAKVIDFGVAKALTQRTAGQTIFTETGQMIGTPIYMSPEQADPSDQDIDTRSDVYSLGVILYELLVGATPFDARDLRSRAYREMQRMIVEVDPPAPSARLSTIATKDVALITKIAAARREAAKDLTRTLKSELEWIPLKALRKERAERYDSPADLARDIQNYLTGRPLSAAPESRLYRARKYVRRNRGLVASIAMIVAALVLGLVTTAWKWRDAVAAQSLAERRRTYAETLLADIAMHDAMKAVADNEGSRVTMELQRADQLGASDRFTARLARALADTSIMSKECRVSCISPDGRVMATGDADVQRWDVATGEPIGRPLALGAKRTASALTFSPDGKTLLAASNDGQVHAWAAATGERIGEPWKVEAVEPHGFVFSPDCRRLAFECGGSRARAIRVIDLTTRATIGERAHEWGHWRFFPDGRSMAVSKSGKSLVVWKPDEGQTHEISIKLGDGDSIRGLAISPDGAFLAASLSHGTEELIRLWNLDADAEIATIASEAALADLAFSLDGRCLLSRDKVRILARELRELDAEAADAASESTSKPVRPKPPNIAVSAPVVVAGCQSYGSLETGKDLATVGAKGTYWDLPSSLATRHLATDSDLFFDAKAVAFTEDGETLLTVGEAIGAIGQRWNVITGRPLGGSPQAGLCKGLCIGPRGHVALIFQDASIEVRDIASGRLIAGPMKGHSGWPDAGSMRHDGKRLVTRCSAEGRQQEIRIWDLESAQQVGDKIMLPDDGGMDQIEYRPDGRMFATFGGEGHLHLLDGDSGQLVRTFAGRSGGWDPRLAWSPDGRMIVRCSAGVIEALDVATGERIWESGVGKSEGARDLSFTPDGATLASLSESGSIRLWDPSTGKEIGHLPGESGGRLTAITFSRDGRTLAAAGSGGTLRLWHTTTVRERYRKVRERAGQIEAARALLADRIQAVGISTADVRGFVEAVRADPRLTGDLQTAALIVAGEVEQDRAERRYRDKKARKARLEPLLEAVRNKRWGPALQLISTVSESDRRALGVSKLNEIAWSGLTELATNDAARNLDMLLSIAQLAVELGQRKDGAVLDTLARAHWERGDQESAVRVQTEAIDRSEQAYSASEAKMKADDQEKWRVQLKEMRETLARYRSEPAPKPVAGTGRQ